MSSLSHKSSQTISYKDKQRDKRTQNPEQEPSKRGIQSPSQEDDIKDKIKDKIETDDDIPEYGDNTEEELPRDKEEMEFEIDYREVFKPKIQFVAKKEKNRWYIGLFPVMIEKGYTHLLEIRELFEETLDNEEDITVLREFGRKRLSELSKVKESTISKSLSYNAYILNIDKNTLLSTKEILGGRGKKRFVIPQEEVKKSIREIIEERREKGYNPEEETEYEEILKRVLKELRGYYKKKYGKRISKSYEKELKGEIEKEFKYLL